MINKYPLRNKNGRFLPEEYLQPSVCECSHINDNHRPHLFHKGECDICKCPKYKRDLDLEGDYVACNQNEADISYYSAFSGYLFFKQVTGGRVEK